MAWIVFIEKNGECDVDALNGFLHVMYMECIWFKECLGFAKVFGRVSEKE